jgi:hypothetical protein
VAAVALVLPMRALADGATPAGSHHRHDGDARTPPAPSAQAGPQPATRRRPACPRRSDRIGHDLSHSSNCHRSACARDPARGAGTGNRRRKYRSCPGRGDGPDSWYHRAVHRAIPAPSHADGFNGRTTRHGAATRRRRRPRRAGSIAPRRPSSRPTLLRCRHRPRRSQLPR